MKIRILKPVRIAGKVVQPKEIVDVEKGVAAMLIGNNQATVEIKKPAAKKPEEEVPAQ